jgi:branched-chain amino acid transport system ATP-binding protein
VSRSLNALVSSNPTSQPLPISKQSQRDSCRAGPLTARARTIGTAGLAAPFSSALAISGLLAPGRGRIVIGGTDLTRQPPAAILRAGVVQVPQGHGLFAGLSVRQNVLMGGYLIRRQRERLERRYDALAELFPPLAERPTVPAGQLSGGQRRMVEFARAMMLEPAVVLLDEPTLGLDPNSLTVIRASVEAMKRAGTTILMVEQNVRFGLGMADRATVMSAGRVASAVMHRSWSSTRG